jgi:hypothetical protein
MAAPWRKRPSDLSPDLPATYVLERPAETWAIDAELKGDLSTPGPVVVTSIDGMGRSTLLERAAREGAEHGWLPLRARCQDQPESFEEVATWFCDQVHDADRQIVAVRTTIRDLVRDWWRRSHRLSLHANVGQVDLGPEIRWGKTAPEGRQDPFVQVQRALREAGHHARDKHRGLLFVIDNVDTLVAGPNGPAYADFIVDVLYKARLDRLPVAAFLSMRTPTLRSVEQRYPDFETRAYHLQVEPLSGPEIGHMIRDWGVSGTITEELLLQRTGGHTTLVKAWLTALRAGLQSGELGLPISDDRWRQLQKTISHSVGQEAYDWMRRAARDCRTTHVAAPTIAFHVAPVEARQSILDHGIDYRRGETASTTAVPASVPRRLHGWPAEWDPRMLPATPIAALQNGPDRPAAPAAEVLPRPAGNYLYSTLDDAMRFVTDHPSADLEVWALNTAGLSLKPDPEPGGEAWYSEAPIPERQLLDLVGAGPDVPRSRAGWIDGAPWERPRQPRRPVLSDSGLGI